MLGSICSRTSGILNEQLQTQWENDMHDRSTGDVVKCKSPIIFQLQVVKCQSNERRGLMQAAGQVFLDVNHIH